MSIKLRTKKRQSGKTYKLLGKMFHYLTNSKSPVFISHNAKSSESALKRFNKISEGVNGESFFVTYKDWYVVVNPITQNIILDDYEYFDKKILKEILKYAKRNNIGVLGYSSKESDRKLFPEAQGEVE